MRNIGTILTSQIENAVQHVVWLATVRIISKHKLPRYVSELVWEPIQDSNPRTSIIRQYYEKD